MYLLFLPKSHHLHDWWKSSRDFHPQWNLTRSWKLAKHQGNKQFPFCLAAGRRVQAETMKGTPGGLRCKDQTETRGDGGVRGECWPKHCGSDSLTCEFWIWMVPGGSAWVNTCPCDVTMATGWYRVPPEAIICCHEYQVSSTATSSQILR